MLPTLTDLPVLADIMGVFFFAWMTSYFYRRSLKEELTMEEKLLFLFVVGGLVIDGFFVTSILVLPRFFKVK
jgi:hypothetical protein